MKVQVQVTNLTGERYWGYDTPLPAQVQIAININIIGVERKNDSLVEAPFVFTVNYAPSIAQMSVKGRAQISGDRIEVAQVVEENKKNKPPPTSVIQAVSSTAMAEAIVMSKTLSIPPPLPPIGVPADGTVGASIKKEPRYTT